MSKKSAQMLLDWAPNLHLDPLNGPQIRKNGPPLGTKITKLHPRGQDEAKSAIYMRKGGPGYEKLVRFGVKNGPKIDQQMR